MSDVQEETDDEIILVPYEPAHRQGIITVVRAVHDEYGFTWEAHGYHRDLYDVNEHYLRDGGQFWVLFHRDQLIGCGGVTVHGRECELHRLYLLREHRGKGLGWRLLETTMNYGREKGCARMIAWSDVKLPDAHVLYRRAGFVQEGERICNDPDKAREYGFWKEPL